MAYRQKEYNYNDKLTKDQNLLMDKLYKMRMSGMAEAFELLRECVDKPTKCFEIMGGGTGMI